VAKGVSISYSDSELEWLENNRKLVISEYQEQFNRIFGRDISKTNLFALKKRKGWKTGRSGQFKKGNIPHPDAGAKSANKTSFKKGLIPVNKVPLYSERINTEGYIEIKVPEENPHTGSKERFKLKHRWVWEQANGAIPKSHILLFVDGDKSNCDLSNLDLVHRGVGAIINKMGYGSAPVGVRRTMIAIGRVRHKMVQLSRELSDRD